MTQTADTQTNELEIKRYLFAEMTDDERAEMEERFFENDDLFFEISDTENRLVDLYAKGKLSGEDLTRFERSLEKFPDRRAKVANAVALQTYIDEERKEEPVPVPIVRKTLRQRLAEFSTFGKPAFGYAMTGMVVLFTLASVFLLLDNRRKTEELARLQNEQNGDRTVWQQRERELQNELINLRETFDRENEASGELSEQLENRQARIEQLQAELERLRRENNQAPRTPTQSSAPTIASFFLAPAIGGRGGNTDTTPRQISVERTVKRISIRLALPDGAVRNERFFVKLNEKIVAQNLPVRVSTSGQLSLQLTIKAEDLAEGLNRLAAVDKTGKEVSKYLFNMQKK